MPAKGFHLYTALDLYSRKVVGWTVQHRQEKTIATRLIEQVIADQELNGHSVEVVHTDNGKVMGPDPRTVDTSGVSYAAWVSVADVSASKSSGARRLHQECRLRVL